VLTLYKGMTPVRSYWRHSQGYYQGDKHRAGDKRTPEGHFYICSMNNTSGSISSWGSAIRASRMQKKACCRTISYDQYREIWSANVERRQPPWDTALGGRSGSMKAPGHRHSTGAEPGELTDGCIG